MEIQERKEALKRLRQEREEHIRAALALVKQQNKDLNRIKEFLSQGPATPVEVAQKLNITPKMAMWYLAAMRKYGLISEAGKNGDYFNYQLNLQEAAVS